jgi:hypothetical protein
MLGILKGTVTIESDFSPVLYMRGEDLYSPIGSWDCYLTLAEARFIERWGLGTFALANGYFWIPKSLSFPLEAEMERLYELRSSLTGLDLEILKRTASGTWGKLMEVYPDRVGKLYNPVWGCHVEAWNRLRVAEFCLRTGLSGCKTLCITVDGCLLDSPVHSFMLGTGMGLWRFSGAEKAIIASSGSVGIGSGADEDFSMGYEKMLALLSADPSATSYAMNRMSFCSLGTALSEARYCDLGQLETHTRSIIIEQAPKRYYPDNPVCGGDLLAGQYNSEPWDIEILEGVLI